MISSGGFRLRSFSLVDIWDAIEIRGVLEGTAVDSLLSGSKRGGPRASEAAMSKATMDIPITVEGFARYLEVNRSFHRELWWSGQEPSPGPRAGARLQDSFFCA